MKILHTADWHIGSFKGPEKEGVNLRSEDTMKCLRSLVETAEKEASLPAPDAMQVRPRLLTLQKARLTHGT